MILLTLRALTSYWRRHRGQLLALLAGLTLATALWSAVQAINGQARSDYVRAAQQLGGTEQTFLARADGGAIPMDSFAQLRRAGWRVSPVMEARVVVGNLRLRVTGLDPFTAAPGTLPPAMAQQLASDPASVMTAPGRGFAAPELVAQLPAESLLPPLDPTPGLPPREIVTDISTVAALPDAELVRLSLHPQQPRFQPPLEQIAPDLVLQAGTGRVDATRLTDSFHLNLTAFGLLSFAVGLFIVHAGIGLAFEQRRATVRTLRALGVPLRTVMITLLVELLCLALIAGGAGVLLGYLLAAALLPDVAATLRGLYGAAVGDGLLFRPVWALSGMAMAVLGTGTAAATGLWALARMPLLASARPRAWSRVSERALWMQAAFGLFLLGLGVVAAWALDGLVAGFTLLGGLLLGAALMLTLSLALVLRLGRSQARSVLGAWFWADAQQQLRGLSMALMALMLALATNIGVGTMVSSFRLTFTGWLDQRLAADLYISARSEEQGAAITDWAQASRLRLLPLVSAEQTLSGRPGDIFGVKDDPLYRDSWPLIAAIAEPWDALHDAGAVLINEQLARSAALWPGQEITLAPGWRVPIAGVYSDYGNPKAQAIVALPELESRFSGLPRLRFGLIAPDTESARTQLQDLGLSQGQITDQAGIKAFSLAIFEQTFAVTAALNVLTLAVAGFAIFTSLTTLAALRLPQLAPVWALGKPRAALARLELLRAVLLAGLTYVLALPVGLALAWSLLAVVNVEAFGWRLPMFLFPSQWVWLGLAALLAALLAAALPARRLARRSPADFLRVFANER